jgi:predicted ATPase
LSDSASTRGGRRQSRRAGANGPHRSRPILAVRWTNVRSFPDTGWRQIRPLTILIGPNNSGKTSFHLPLLLLKQTLLSKDPTVALMTRGSIVNAGSFWDLVHGHDVGRHIDLSLRFLHDDPTRGQKLKKLGQYPPGSVELSFGLAADGSTELTQYRARDRYGRLYLERRRLASGRYSLLRMPVKIPPMHANPRTAQRKLQNALRLRALADQPSHFLFSPLFLTHAIEDLSPKALDVELPGWAVLYAGIIGSVREELTQALRALDYLGPLRERPQRLYLLSGETPEAVGSRGEHAPELLFRSDASFKRSVGRWLRRMGLASDVGTEAVSDDAFSVELRRSTRSPWVNLADTGFGISQVLPLIVQSLRSDQIGLLVAEQPEIHLNPKLQALLADLFIEAASEDRPIVVETHSEHLVLRLRRLIAEGAFRANDVALYYVERSGDESSIREVVIQPDGSVARDAWPRGFFEDSLSEALGLAQAQIRPRKS